MPQEFEYHNFRIYRIKGFRLSLKFAIIYGNPTVQNAVKILLNFQKSNLKFLFFKIKVL